MSLFNLALAIGLEAKHCANDNLVQSGSNRVQSGLARVAQSIESKGFSGKSGESGYFRPEFIDNTASAANDDGLPEYHYRGENLTFWMASNEKLQQLKHGDSAWIEAKLRRVPANQRRSLADEYSARYKAAYDAEPDSNKKTNRAAFTANTWLLKVTQ